MAEIATMDDAQENVDAEIEMETEVQKIDADQTEVPEEKNVENEIKSHEEKDVEDNKATDFAAYMVDLSKATGEVNSNSVSSIWLKYRELQGQIKRLSKQNQSLMNDLSRLKELNFFVKRNESLFEEN
ncbi:hypothetical protein Hanom_Chr03g00229711 [Helianthus anomalus]